MGVGVCVSSETMWFPTLIGQKQGSLSAFDTSTPKGVGVSISYQKIE